MRTLIRNSSLCKVRTVEPTGEIVALRIIMTSRFLDDEWQTFEKSSTSPSESESETRLP